VEEIFKSRPLDDDVIENAARMASEESRPRLTSSRVSRGYKREMLKVLTKQGIKQSLEKV
jgi:CO/xanthine dehydrogenase FAD-binding subunit